jgi:hypothetical protein
MKSLFGVTGALLLMAAPMAHAGDAGVDATIRQVTDAFAKLDMKAIKALHVAAPAINDEFAPFHWSGANAFDTWSAALGKSEAAEGISGGQMAIAAPSREVVTGDHAYVVTPATYTFKQKGVTMRETAQFTFILNKEASGWKIASWTWTSPDPKPVH